MAKTDLLDTPTEERGRAPFVALGMSTGMLLMQGIRGSADVRLGAAAGLLAIVVAVAVLAARVRSIDHGESGRPPVWHDLVGEAITGRGRAFVFLTTFLTFLFVATNGKGARPTNPIPWIGPVVASVAGIVLLLAIASVVRRALRSEGVERQLFFESTCIAFFFTVLVVGIYATIEALADAPRLPAWVLWVAGVGTWALVSGLRGRTVR